MLQFLKFGRIDKTSVLRHFQYTESPGTEFDFAARNLDMSGIGAHWNISVRNYMREDVLLVSSLRAKPLRVRSIYESKGFRSTDYNNMVVVELTHKENAYTTDGGIKTVQQKKIVIQCPGHHLQTHSLFIDEIGCYVTVESRLPAVRETIAADIQHPENDGVSVNAEELKPDPVCTLQEYESLVNLSIERADKILVRVGVPVDVDPQRVPDALKSMRICILDHHFSPYLSNKMVYDPTLQENEFVVENIHYTGSGELISTFDRLATHPGRAHYVDTQERATMGGMLCGLVIFADPDALTEYLFKHKADVTYNELMERVIDKTGSHALTTRIAELEAALANKDTRLTELEASVKTERTITADLKRTLAAREETIKKLQTNHDAEMSYAAVMGEIENTRTKHELDREKLKVEQQDIKVKKSVGLWKAAADIIKSGWGLTVAIAGIVAAGMKWWNKLKLAGV